jgi:DNA (cytosine-5)-methyltransferase 1
MDKFNAIDLFSGAGGMSYGFHRHNFFHLFAAFDAERGKPSSGDTLECNTTYSANMGFEPFKVDLGSIDSKSFNSLLEKPVDVFIACPPCTGFSRANPNNHLIDDSRNNLVVKSAELAVETDAKIVVMENARELITGNFKHHYQEFKRVLQENGFQVYGKTYFLSDFGLPQIRERAIIIAAKVPLKLHSMEELWEDFEISSQSKTVKSAFSILNKENDEEQVFPSFKSDEVLNRIKAIPKDGGSWIDLLDMPHGHELLTDSMKRNLELGKIGSYPDVYGRLAWEKPSPTIKRECSHVGNGRYAHPEEDRLCSVRELAILNGFPTEYQFPANSLSNKYRHIGDAVPPLISYQIANLVSWILTGDKPSIEEMILPNTTLRNNHVKRIVPEYEHAF